MKLRIFVMAAVVLGASLSWAAAGATDELAPLKSAQAAIRQLNLDFQRAHALRAAQLQAPSAGEVSDVVSGKGEVKGDGPIYWFGTGHWFSGSIPVQGTIQLSVADYAGSVTLKGNIYVGGNDGLFLASGEGDVSGDAELAAPGGRSLKIKVTRHVKVSGQADFMNASVSGQVEIREDVKVEKPVAAGAVPATHSLRGPGELIVIPF